MQEVPAAVSQRKIKGIHPAGYIVDEILNTDGFTDLKAVALNALSQPPQCETCKQPITCWCLRCHVCEEHDEEE